jgi:hypothetical protein
MTWDCCLAHRDGDLKTLVGETRDEAVSKALAFASSHRGVYIFILPAHETGSRPYPADVGRVLAERRKADRERMLTELDAMVLVGDWRGTVLPMPEGKR